jgi:hypothetical protein
MYGIKRSNRLAWERLTRALDNLCANPQHVPVRGRRRQMRSSICSLSLG